ncbi:MAG: ABC transporter ATP-binding protein [Deltaproteobacteria bacterium]|nr:ABC transporter ATP-binding protein [Deltaproteobacteria bacterium]MBT4091058.1 ABC transporter ATP-binding protein [Deltaproteobacteria bacterium]MBT4266253.1 ABC transporter ATP-binding protein [Deltaproteobacteria bacterium]MBT4639964.1 ABC transporter ATP-binding protein [Deltaproteobacteria bacterium]MBT6503796.1 ABC transporter ATP-binding protein [Deltaproteobacteria bacterium]
MSNLRFLFHYLSNFKFSYILGIIFIVLTNWIAVTIPGYLKLCIDLLSESSGDLRSNTDQLFEYLLMMFGLALSIIIVRTLSRVFFFNPGRAIEFQIKNDLFKKLTLLQKNFYEKNPTGTIISKIQNDINGVRMICGFGMMQVFNIMTALSFAPIKMWQLSAPLTLYTVLPIIVVFIIIRFSMHFVIRYTRARMLTLQKISSFIISSLSGIDVIKSYDINKLNIENFEETNKEMMNQSLKISFIRSFFMPLLQNLENILRVIILLVGGSMVINASLTIGELTAFIAYLALLTMPIMGLGWLTTIFQTGIIGVTSLLTILNQEIPETKIEPLPRAVRKQLFDQGLDIKNLSYTYPDQDEPALKNISFSILPNQTVGILGKIGSGKTTLINCLNRYLLIDNHQVFMGHHDLSDLSLVDVRSVIHTVSQDVFLFSDSIRNNILFGTKQAENLANPDLTDVILESALQEDIFRFQDGLDTMVGEKGIMLSGGQKQRISLARALMTPCDLLILDNVLSAVDHETERFLLEHIHKRRTARSLLIVSNRVQALEQANLILVLDEGRIVARGTHQSLIIQDGLYRETWELQQSE